MLAIGMEAWLEEAALCLGGMRNLREIISGERGEFR
jgi:hypothetical protein